MRRNPVTGRSYSTMVVHALLSTANTDIAVLPGPLHMLSFAGTSGL